MIGNDIIFILVFHFTVYDEYLIVTCSHCYFIHIVMYGLIRSCVYLFIKNGIELCGPYMYMVEGDMNFLLVFHLTVYDVCFIFTYLYYYFIYIVMHRLIQACIYLFVKDEIELYGLYIHMNFLLVFHITIHDEYLIVTYLYYYFIYIVMYRLIQACICLFVKDFFLCDA